MAFEDLKKELDDICYSNGLDIYKELKSRYPEKNARDMDIILNSLCCSLIFHIHQNVEKDNWPVMIQIIHKILTKNC